jgi:uncharacterized lipoprotein NlpE involved in copper resistance
MPRKVFTAGEVLTAADVNSNLMDQAVMTFTNAAARTSAIPSPVEGMLTYLADVDLFQFYNGTIWVNVNPGQSDKAAGYTLTSADRNTYIRSTGSAITITVPDVLANGDSVNFIQAGAGQITFAGSGVTINSADAKLKTNKQFSGATITKVGGAYYLVGDLAA